MSGELAGAVDLHKRGSVPIVNQSIIMPGAIDANYGDLAQPGCTMHFRLIDISHGTAYYLPCNTTLARKLIARALELCDEIDRAHTQIGERNAT